MDRQLDCSKQRIIVVSVYDKHWYCLEQWVIVSVLGKHLNFKTMGMSRTINGYICLGLTHGLFRIMDSWTDTWTV